MKKLALLFTGAAGLMWLAAATPTLAAESGQGQGGTERTVTGEAKCAKCALKESDKCQTVIETEGRNGNKVKLYLADNDVAKKFHEEICKEPKKVTAKGTVKRLDDGKREFTVTEIKVVKDAK
jgi:hypothetical protein